MVKKMVPKLGSFEVDSEKLVPKPVFLGGQGKHWF